MANHRAKNRGSPRTIGSARSAGSNRTATLSRRKLWVFRITALLAAPLLFGGLLELGLRLVGVGYPTAFLLPATHNGEEVLVQNNQFGWRFFGPRRARLPEPLLLTRHKPAGTIRIFLFGESAAKGEPQSAFGPARLLQVLLNERHPGVRFEVVNAAMTAINSHAILPIARDCAKAGGDIWIIYMGNNEVVGPFGAGTVFGEKSPPQGLIRATLALKATRTGQLLDSWLGRVSGPAATDGEWRGMKMFLDQQVAAEDPRMASVYQSFERNLEEIITTGKRSGAGVVVSTVAVNLRDCAPFASVHRPPLSVEDKVKWDKAYQLGSAARREGRPAEAMKYFAEAAGLDASYAELRFQQGQCALALGKNVEALDDFKAARDLDTLRFRCDTRLNKLIRASTTNRENERILLADVERAFANASKDGLPGTDYFYEHVHPNFSGNYLLARTLAVEVEALLPANRASRSDQPWPSEADCARRLGWSDWSRLGVLRDVQARVQAPPFLQQVNHAEQLHTLTIQVEALSPSSQPRGLLAARETVAAALVKFPDDAVLLGLLASLQQLGGQTESAIASTRRALELLPTNPQTWLQLGLLLIRQQNIDEASSAFRRAVELDPADALARQNLAQSLWQTGRRKEAMVQYRKAVELQPSLAVAWINLGQVLVESGRKAEAESCFQQALTCKPTRASDLLALARFSRSRGWNEAAATNYATAVGASPGDVTLRLEAGEYMLVLKRNAEAAEFFAQATRLSPDSARAHHLYGAVLGQQGRAVEAEREFREALQIDPGLLEARLNLGISLLSQGRSDEALAVLEEVLSASPTNELALKYSERLRGQPGSGGLK